MGKSLPKWYKLDNAAKMIPSTTRGADTRVFRLVCELKEEVDPNLLQRALEEALQEFPHFRSVLRKGLFWYYLDQSRETVSVQKENSPVCSSIYLPGRRNILFRVLYFKRRISLEAFHVLADGTGAFMFFRTMISSYLVHRYQLDPLFIVHEEASAKEKSADAFGHFYGENTRAAQLSEMTTKRAYQLRAERDPDMRVHCVEGTVSAQKFLEVARSYQTTAGVLSTSLFIEAVLDEMKKRDQRYPVVISVPVNLRQFFHSATSRNFFGVINISYSAKDYDGTLESVIGPVKREFSRQLTQENIQNTMNSYAALEHNLAIRSVPLFIKDFVIQRYAYFAKKGTTATMSNLGVIPMPEELQPYIHKFSAFMTARNLQVCVSSYGDHMVFGAASGFSEHTLMLHFFRRLTKLGIEVEVATNDYDDPEVKGSHAVLS